MKAFRKDILRTIKGSLGRFLAIFLIVGLGSGFYAALRMICPDMKIAADSYFDSSNMMDVRIVSTLGLVEEDLNAINNIDSVEKATLAYETDITGELNGDQVIMRLHSMTNDDSLNTIELKEGRFPASKGECVISSDCVINTEKKIGDKINIKDCSSDIDSTLATKELEIVGVVESPLYVDFASPGSTTLGSGQLEDYAYVTNDTFAESYPYNEIFLTIKGASALYSYSDEYSSKVEATLNQIKNIAPEREQARLNSLKDESQAELDKRKQEYEEKKAQTYAQLDEAQNTLDSSKNELDSAKSSLDEAPVELVLAERKISEGTSQLEQGKSALNELKSQKSSLDSSIATLKAALDSMSPSDPEYEGTKAQYEALLALNRQLDAGISQAEASVASAQAQLDSANAQYNAAKQQYYKGLSDYQNGLDSYNQGTESLQTSRNEAEIQLAEAKKKLDDAQTQIDNLKTPEWLIMDRSKIESAESYKTDAERVDSIAQLFPLIFFLVAALVALTTMTRMIEEERLYIGTYKALGYSQLKIASKYLIYAAIASACGAICGILILSEVLPNIIMDAYGTMYRMPHTTLVPLDIPIALLSFVAGVGITLLVTFTVVLSSLRESPSSLLRPKQGKAGTKILLERASFIWNKLSFSGKVTVRNLIRYKKRSLMTIIGIGGCTGLLLTGFGLNDSLNDMIDKQYNELVNYSATITKVDSPTDSGNLSLEAIMENDTYVTSSAEVQSNLVVTSDDNKDVHASLIVPKDYESLKSVWKIQDRTTKKALEEPSDGVLVCEKLKNLYNLEVGDGITICQQDSMGNASNKKIFVKVEGFFENYLFNYIFCSPSTYSKLYDDKTPEYNTFLAKTNSENITNSDFSTISFSTSAVKSVSFKDEKISTYKTSLSAVNMVVVVLIACAALLAFIVLYNLNNINICERKREIATLKVLGFTDHEVTMYIYRETIILTLLGCLFGLLFGVFLEGFVVSSAEGNLMMFGRDIHLLSYIISSVVTIIFSCLVMFVMRRKFKKVDMVESLKSIE